MCGTGFIDAVALMVELGVVDDSGRLLEAEDVDGPVSAWMGEEECGCVFYLTADHSIYITQRDVRNLQLAKAAVCAGIFTMLKHANLEVSDIESLQIAGGFGAYLDLASAARIGLFPKELLPLASSVGNTSGEGATALLVSSAAHEREQRIVDVCDYLELSTSMDFNNFYIRMMEFD